MQLPGKLAFFDFQSQFSVSKISWSSLKMIFFFQYVNSRVTVVKLSYVAILKYFIFQKCARFFIAPRFWKYEKITWLPLIWTLDYPILGASLQLIPSWITVLNTRVPSRLEFQVPHSTERPTLITNQSHIFFLSTSLFRPTRLCVLPS